jgi:hypothetical protein
MSVRAYKAFDKTMQCRGFQFEAGKTYEHDGEVVGCSSGFHACENPLDVWSYYPLDSRYAVVDLSGAVSRHDDDSKIAAARITISAEIDLPQIISDGIAYLMGLCNDAFALKPDAAASGDRSQLAASGNGSQLAASGDRSQLAASGNGSQLAASGNSSQLAASGNGSQLAASGDGSQLAASGDRSQLAASGNGSQLAASGDGSQLAASGNGSQLAASGNGSQLAASGDGSKLAALGRPQPARRLGLLQQARRLGRRQRLHVSRPRRNRAGRRWRSHCPYLPRWHPLPHRCCIRRRGRNRAARRLPRHRFR